MAQDRTIKVVLDAKIDAFKRQMAEASKAVEEFGTNAPRNTKPAETALGKLVQSADRNRESWASAGSTMMKVGGVITGIGVAAAATGVAYNKLQQTSRAALTTLLGSAAAANAQMAQLDKFASTSPFAKDVFIRAQQQMLAFGIETKKVIPYLDSIQNAVAAAGGSNHDVAELARIMSQISASAKITATDLREFGNRGVDAASIIGLAMGKSGSEIRDEITAGTLDAGEALDALAEGMSERFAGASENVKQTLAGAFDRVKAAWRDLSGELMEPFVGKEGGGILVSLANGAADLMRAFQRLPEPIKAVTVGVVALTAAMLLGGGAFLRYGAGAIEAIKHLRAFAALHPMLYASIVKMPGVLGLAAAGTVGLGMALDKLIGLSVLTVEVDDLVDAFQRLHEATGPNQRQNLRKSIDEMLSGKDDWWGQATMAADIDGLAAALQNLDVRASMLWSNLDKYSFMNADNQQADNAITALNEAFARMLESGNIEAAKTLYSEWAATAAEAGTQMYMTDENIEWYLASLGDHNAALRAAAAETAEADSQIERFGHTLHENVAIVTDTGRAYDKYGREVDTATGELLEHVSAVEKVIDAQETLANNLLGERGAWRDYYEAIDEATAALSENGKTLDVTTEKGRENEEALDEMVSTTWSLIEAMSENDATAGELRTTMNDARAAVVEMAISFGMTEEAANDYADAVGLIPEDVSTAVRIDSDDAYNRAREYSSAVWDIPTSRTTTLTLKYEEAYAAARAAASSNWSYSVTQRAAGGVDVYGNAVARVPQLRTADKGAVLWGEPSTGWEAYISGDPAHRADNIKYWAEAGARLGVPAHAASGSAAIDYQALAAAVASAMPVSELSEAVRAGSAAGTASGSASGVAAGFAGGSLTIDSMGGGA